MTEEEKKRQQQQQEQQRKRQAAQAAAKARAQQQDAQAAEQAVANVESEKPQATFAEQKAQKSKETKANVQTFLGNNRGGEMTTLESVYQNAKPKEEYQAEVDAYNRQEQQKADREWDKKANESYKAAGSKVTKAGEVDPLLKGTSAEKLFPELVKNGTIDVTGGAANQFITGTEHSLDPAKIASVQDLAHIASALTDEKDKYTLIDAYAKNNKLNADDVYWQVEQYSGNRVFSTPQSSRGKATEIGVYNDYGEKLDSSKMTADQFWRAIELTYDADDRATLLDAYKKLYPDYNVKGLKAPGFLDSADMTKSEYDKRVDEMNASFTVGASEANSNAYMDQLNALREEYGNNPRVLAQMERALLKSYERITNKKAPTSDEVQAAMEEWAMEEKLATIAGEQAEQEKGWLGKAWDATGGALLDKLFPDEDAKPREIPTKEPEEVEPVEEATGYNYGGYWGGGWTSGGSASSYAEASSASMPTVNPSEQAGAQASETAAETAAVVANALESPLGTGGAERNAPVIAGNNVAPTIEGKGVVKGGSVASAIDSGQVPSEYKLPYNPNMTDDEVLAAYSAGYVVDERNMAGLKPLLDNPNARGILMDTHGVYANVRQEGGGSRLVNMNQHYGFAIGSAASVLDNGSLPADLEGLGRRELASLVNDIDEDVRLGIITVPTGANQYTYAIAENEAYQKRVQRVADLQKEADAAYLEQVQKEKEAEETVIADIKARMMSGKPVSEAELGMVAEKYKDTRGDITDDETVLKYYRDIGKNKLFADNSEYWTRDSAAAQSAGVLLAQPRKSEFNKFRNVLYNETKNVVEDYARMALGMGVSLEELLISAGLDEPSKLADVAYNNVIARGEAFSKDEEAQAAIDAINNAAASEHNALTATGLGARHGIEKFASGFAKTSYMILDDADYAEAVLDLEREYTARYGDLGRYMYRKQLTDYANSGEMSQDAAADLLANISHARDIFDVGYELDPGFLEGFARNNYEAIQKDVEQLEAVASTLPPRLQKFFSGVSSLTYSGATMVASAVVGGVAGAAGASANVASIVGAVAGTGFPSYADAYTDNIRNKKMPPGLAKAMAFFEAAAMTSLNIGSTGVDIETFWGDSTYSLLKGAMTGKGGSSMIKLLGRWFSRSAGEGIEEVQENLIGKGFDVTADAAVMLESGRPVPLSKLCGSVMDNVYETDPVELFSELATDFGAGFAMSGVFSLAGAAKAFGQARTGANMQGQYSSIDLATQIVDGNLEFNEENVGKVYAALQKDLLDARFRKYIDSGHVAAVDQRANVIAVAMGTGEADRVKAVEYAQMAEEHSTKAEAARAARDTAQGTYWELRDRLASGDLSVQAALESARMQWQKAQTSLAEAESESSKALDNSKQAMEAWLAACRQQSGIVKGWMLEEQANNMLAARQAAAEELARRYEAEEAERNALTTNLVRGDAGTQEQLALNKAATDANIQTAENVAAADDGRAYAEGALFSEEGFEENAEADNSDVDSMTDEELDNEFASLTAQIEEAESRVSSVTEQSEELGLDSDTQQALADQEVSPLKNRRDSIIAKEKNRFNDLFDRMQQAIEMDNDEAADQIQTEYDSVMARLQRMGVDTDALVMAQYGVSPEAVADSEAQAQTNAENAEHEKVTASLARRMEKTAMDMEMIQPARRYFMNTPLFVNESQKANLLSADGAKTLSRFNYKYGTKLTDKAEAGAMPLDGHALSDIAAEAAGTVDIESAHPEEELLRIMQTGKKLAADQREEKREAREIKEKKRKAKEKRKEEVSKLTAKEEAQAETDAKQEANSGVDALVTKGNAQTEVDAANAPSTPAQAQQTLTKKGQKLESNALRAVQKLADDLNLGFRIKSDARFQSADARVGKGVAGYYKNGQRNAIVRSKMAGRLDVSGHEVGHGLQELMGMSSTQKMIDSWKKHFPNTGAYTPAQYDHEAFAEFFWRYLTGRDAAVAYTDSDTVDAFEYALRQNKKIRKAVLNAQRGVSLYYNSSDTSAKIGANIVTTADANKKNRPFARTAEARFVDDTAAVEDFQNVIRERIGEGHLPFDLNLRDTIRYNRRASSRAAQCISEGMVDNNGVIIDESLTDVFSEIKGSDYDLYMRWWLARHSIDRDNRKGSKGQVFDENALSTKKRTDFITETELAHPEFERTNERFQKWRRRLMDTYLVETGLMGDPKKASALLDMLEQIYPYYAPTKRAGKGKAAAVARGISGQKKYAMHEATGSTEDIIDPFESFVGMVNGIVSMAAENDNKTKFAELYDAFGSRNPGEMGAGVGMFANEITQDMQKNAVDLTAMREKIEKMLDDIDTDPDVIMQIGDIIGDEKVQYKGKGRVDMNNVISVRDTDGNDRYFEIYNPEMFKLLSSVSGQGARDQKTLAQTVSMLTRSMSMLTTGSNPVFGITNAMRDFQNSVNYGSWATSYIDGAAKWLATLKDVVTNSEVSQEYDRLGGGGWSQYDTRSKKSADRIKSEVFKGYNTKNIGSVGRMAGRAIWRVATMEDLNGWIEKTSRLAEYKYGKHDRTTAEGKIEAFLAAQDVTTDFARRGNSLLVRDLKSVVPFFNASLQGIYRNARQFTAQESDRAKVRLAKQITNTALASLLANSLLMEFLDDDEKEEFTYLNPDLTAKHMFLPNFAPDILGDASLIRIPLDQNPISYAINAAVSNMVWKGETGDEFLVEMAALADVIMDNLNPASSTIFDPMVSVISNKNWYGSKIVPTYLESYDTMNRYTEETPQAFVTGSEILDGIGVKISPMMLQYLAQQYTGYIGQTLIPALPSEKNKNGVITGIFNALAATARSRVTSDPLKSNDMISMVYDSITELGEVSKAGKSKRAFEIGYLNPALSDRDKERAIDEAYDLTNKGGALYDAKKELTELDDEIDTINADDKLSDERKQELIASIRREKIEIALDVKEIMDNYNVRYKYEGILPRWLAKQFYK